jgi:hypothetical protein
MPTTAAPAFVTTGTALKTMLQIATPSTAKLRVVAWGVQFDVIPTAPITCELVQTDVAATVTAHVAAGVQPYGDSGSPASLMTLGTTATGFTSTGEGTVTATRQADVQRLTGTNQFKWEWSLGREFEMPVSKFLRVRMTTATAINAYTYIIWEE